MERHALGRAGRAWAGARQPGAADLTIPERKGCRFVGDRELSSPPPPTRLDARSGDHTVKISCARTQRVVRTLTGHRRTPWVVRFHPRLPHLLASGSLDNEMRLWDASTGRCLARHTFGKPIASLSFHASATVMAVACGHKVGDREGICFFFPPVCVRA